jgi:hypothetical protein
MAQNFFNKGGKTMPSKKRKISIEHTEEQISLYIGRLKGSDAGGLLYRTILWKIEEWICIRKGLELLKDMEEL